MKRKINIIFYLILIFSLVLFTAVFLSSCAFLTEIFGGKDKNEEPSETGINVSGRVWVDPNIPSMSSVVVGFMDIDPNAQNVPSPIPWANFEGSYQVIGDYYGGGGTYDFSFEGIQEGQYWMMAIVDHNGNHQLDYDESTGEMLEPVGAYPFNEEGDIYFMDFNTDKSGIEIAIYALGPGYDEPVDTWIIPGQIYGIGIDDYYEIYALYQYTDSSYRIYTIDTSTNFVEEWTSNIPSSSEKLGVDSSGNCYIGYYDSVNYWYVLRKFFSDGVWDGNDWWTDGSVGILYDMYAKRDGYVYASYYGVQNETTDYWVELYDSTGVSQTAMNATFDYVAASTSYLFCGNNTDTGNRIDVYIINYSETGVDHVAYVWWTKEGSIIDLATGIDDTLYVLMSIWENDEEYYYVKKYDYSGNLLDSWMISGSPNSIAVDKDGYVYVALFNYDVNDFMVCKYEPHQ